MSKNLIKNIEENRVRLSANQFENKVSITFETNNNGNSKVETITLVGNGTLKSAVLV